jgi:hypothetical protein
MEHFIYKITHKNGKYYVGRHSTDNIDDGYIGSGRWPRSLKNRSNVTREILEWADCFEDLVELERRYLTEHFGKPGCMNMTPDPVGWSSEHNPMKRADIVERLSGDNHWTRKNSDAHEILSDIQKKLVESGTHVFLGDKNPNKDGRNAKLAMERGTHINLTEDNPAKQWSRNGTHPWFAKADGTSIGSITNKKRVENGTHNFLGSEGNQKRIKNGTHNLLGSSANERMLAEGKHPSQIKIVCEHCGATSSKGMHSRWHGENCRKKQK